MTLTEKRVHEIKNACLTAVHKAMRDYTALTVAELHKEAIRAAESIRATNELAYVHFDIDNDDDSAFTLVVDLTSGEDDAFHIDYGIMPVLGTDKLKAVFNGSGDLRDKR